MDTYFELHVMCLWSEPCGVITEFSLTLSFLAAPSVCQSVKTKAFVRSTSVLSVLNLFDLCFDQYGNLCMYFS